MQKMKHFADVFTRGLHPKFGWYSGWDLLRRVYFVLVALWLPYLYISTRLVCAHSILPSHSLPFLLFPIPALFPHPTYFITYPLLHHPPFTILYLSTSFPLPPSLSTLFSLPFYSLRW